VRRQTATQSAEPPDTRTDGWPPPSSVSTAHDQNAVPLDAKTAGVEASPIFRLLDNS